MTFFAFDSRENHQKISSTGTTGISVPAFASGQVDTIATHSLGYFPNVRVYFDFSGDVWPATAEPWAGAGLDLKSSVYNTTTALKLKSDSTSASTQEPDILYRIYKDGDVTNNTSFSSFESFERITKVIKGSFTATASTFTTETVAHGLGEKVFTVMRWNDGGEWFDQDIPNWNTDRSATINVIAHADATNVYIEANNTYGGNRTVTYEVYLYKLVDDNVLFDSRDATFTNFEEGSTAITLSGTINDATTTDFTGTISHSDADTLGLMYLNRSDDSSNDYAVSPLPNPDLKVPTDAADIDAIIRVEHKTNATDITVSVRNESGAQRTITSATWTFRYALFRV